MKRLYLLENKYQEQQTVIANQQAEIANKIKFGADYRAEGEETDLEDLVDGSIDSQGLTKSIKKAVRDMKDSPGKPKGPDLNQDRVVYYQGLIRNMKLLQTDVIDSNIVV